MRLRLSTLIFTLLVTAIFPAQADPAAEIARILDEAEAISPLETVIVAHQGRVIVERGYRGHSTTEPTNIKSASKSVISALVGIAIDKGLLEGPDQRVAPLLEADLPTESDPRMKEITIGHLLSMQAGLASTSGGDYGAWVASSDWVEAALAQPFADDPGGRMIYSTGSTHLLSAILTRETGRSTLELAQDWLGPLDGFEITAWERDPQGIHLGGNQMAMSPRSLLTFGELYRNGGVTPDGDRLLSQEWIETSWESRTRSRYTGDGYGYGWFLSQIAGQAVRYGWGYGGQMVYVVPRLELTVIMTSDENASAARTGHRDDLHGLLSEIITIIAGVDGAAMDEQPTM